MKIVDFEFDKEMDTLLRRSAQGESAFASSISKSKIENPNSAHLDADEISAFAENVLTAKMRARATEHFADCARCRTILSNLIALDAEAESETIHAAAGERIIPPPALPWHKRFFAFPQLTYAVGALALIFAAVIGFVVLQSREGAQNSSVARIEETSERPLNGKGASSDGETVSTGTFSSNASSANTAMNSNTTVAGNVTNGSTATVNSSPARVANSNASAAQTESKPEDDRVAETAPKPAQPVAAPAPASREEVRVTADDAENRVQTDGADSAAPRQAERSRNDAQNNSALNQQNIAPDSRSVQRRAQIQDLPLNGRSQRELQTSEQEPPAEAKRKAEGAGQKAAKKGSESAETRAVGGKTFRRADGVWYDAQYRNQPTTNLRRGTDEYKKLDSRLRRIADNLGGVIVVVWSGRAYRIQ